MSTMIPLTFLYDELGVSDNANDNNNDCPRDHFESPPDFEYDDHYHDDSFLKTTSIVKDFQIFNNKAAVDLDLDLDLDFEIEVNPNIHPILVGICKTLSDMFRNNSVDDNIRSFMGRNTKPQREKIADELDIDNLNLSDDTCQILSNYLSEKLYVFPSHNTIRCIMYEPNTPTNTTTLADPIMFSRNGTEIIKDNDEFNQIIISITIRKAKQMLSAELKGYLASIGHHELINMNKAEVLYAYQDLYLNRTG